MNGKKRLIMVRHADGREDYVCPKCDSVMVHATSGGMSFSAGEVDDNIHEFLSCPECGLGMDYPKINLEGISVHGNNVARKSTEVLGGEAIG